LATRAVRSLFTRGTGLHKSFTMVHAERALVICNHRTRLDWLFLWLWFFRFGQIEQLKVRFGD
jgi:1-acyl-sn-glycerol-3-phosphate acyltransferase